MKMTTAAVMVTFLAGLAAARAQDDRPAAAPQAAESASVKPATVEPPPAAPTDSAANRAGTEITQAEFEAAAARHGFSESCLRLTDTARGFMNALAAMNGDRHTIYGTGFSVEICSPANWIARRMAQARRQYQQLTWADLDEQDRASVLHVLALPDRTTNLNVENGKSVAHVVLRHPDKKRRQTVVAQPLFKRAFGVEQQNNLGGRAMLDGVDAAFPFAALAAVRDEKGEFLVTVVGEAGEKNFKVKQKHLDDLGLK